MITFKKVKPFLSLFVLTNASAEVCDPVDILNYVGEKKGLVIKYSLKPTAEQLHLAAKTCTAINAGDFKFGQFSEPELMEAFNEAENNTNKYSRAKIKVLAEALSLAYSDSVLESENIKNRSCTEDGLASNFFKVRGDLECHKFSAIAEYKGTAELLDSYLETCDNISLDASELKELLLALSGLKSNYDNEINTIEANGIRSEQWPQYNRMDNSSNGTYISCPLPYRDITKSHQENEMDAVSNKVSQNLESLNIFNK